MEENYSDEQEQLDRAREADHEWFEDETVCRESFLQFVAEYADLDEEWERHCAELFSTGDDQSGDSEPNETQIRRCMAAIDLVTAENGDASPKWFKDFAKNRTPLSPKQLAWIGGLFKKAGITPSDEWFRANLDGKYAEQIRWMPDWKYANVEPLLNASEREHVVKLRKSRRGIRELRNSKFRRKRRSSTERSVA
jgi:hypothetical protein